MKTVQDKLGMCSINDTEYLFTRYTLCNTIPYEEDDFQTLCEGQLFNYIIYTLKTNVYIYESRGGKNSVSGNKFS